MSGRAHHNPEHARPGSPRPAQWPVNSATRFDRSPTLPHLAIGHRHLRALRIAHETIGDRGVLEAVRLLEPRHLTRAAVACRYFDLEDLAELLGRAEQAAGAAPDAAAFDDEYRRRFVAGTAVRDAIARKMAECPADFPE
jgi:hypothetical protein